MAQELRNAETSAAFEELVERLRKGSVRQELTAGGLWGASQAFVLAELGRRAQGPWIAVVSTDAEAEAFAEDLTQFGADPFVCPSLDRGASDPDAIRARLTLAAKLAGPPEDRPRLVVLSALSLLETVPDAQDLAAQFLPLAVGEPLQLDHLLARLVKAGFERQPLVERPGELSLRGDILDVWPAASELPLRIELFDDEIESLRTFDPGEQRSVASLDSTEICLATELATNRGAYIFRRLAPTAVFVTIEPLRVQERTEDLRIQSADHTRALLELHAVRADHAKLALQSLPGGGVDFDTRSTQFLAGGLDGLPERALDATSPGRATDAPQQSAELVIFCRSENEIERLQKALAPLGPVGLGGVGPVDPLGEARVRLARGSISKGFRFPAHGLVAVNYREIVGVQGGVLRQKKRAHYKTRALQSFFELKPGDYVVHAVHGLARFVGLVRMARGGGEEEHLHLEFADDVSLFVPAARIDLVQRYIGSGASAHKGPPLDKIGGKAFKKRKEKVERALYDLASDLLEVQAQRELKERPAWASDPDIVSQMIDAFPYTETGDQVSAEEEIANDLGGPRPMDRLLCGDVGFGKTEVAMRAAIRVVTGGGQVAVLAPTTVLASQHERSFRTRFEGLPVRVESLSRYVTGNAAKDVVLAVARGEVDVLIGTHRILSKDVTFKNLGLVVIDEEQRFGVSHKEHFKRFRAEVDVLTLSATPIPRTLHMSLSGLRDISALSEPPAGRQDIHTKLVYDTDTELLRQAILREHNRGGQSFFLYNHVAAIRGRAHELAQLVPECSFGVGHGQMSAHELRRVMDGFARGEFDVLVASTIIENGLDIPAAGTIFIDEADRFGLSEMHQLRGRVGRGTQEAWCYLIVSKTKPIRQVAKERIKALEELSHLGAGFAISMKDLEIRGAGNILGPEQSGHIGAVGYDMYCRLLKLTVERVRSGLEPGEHLPGEDDGSGVELELGLRAYLPETWIPSQETRIEILRELDAIASDPDTNRVEEVLASLADRFGRVPEEARELVRQFRLRGRLAPLGIKRLAWRQESYLLEYTDRIALEHLLKRKRVELRPVREGLALLVVPPEQREPKKALKWFEELLEDPPWVRA